MNLSSEQVNRISKGDEEISSFIHALLEQNQQLIERIDQQAKEIVQLKAEVHELKRQLGQNSNNSSKPPSSDGPRQVMNTRKSGGPKGPPKNHSGSTLRFSNQPDEIVWHKLTTCSNCATSLDASESHSYEKR